MLSMICTISFQFKDNLSLLCNRFDGGVTQVDKLSFKCFFFNHLIVSASSWPILKTGFLSRLMLVEMLLLQFTQ